MGEHAEDAHERYWQARSTEVPQVVPNVGRFVAAEGGLWCGHFQVYTAGVVFNLTYLLPQQQSQRLLDDFDAAENMSRRALTVIVDGEELQANGPQVAQLGWSFNAPVLETRWWVDRRPERDIAIAVEWPDWTDARIDLGRA